MSRILSSSFFLLIPQAILLMAPKLRNREPATLDETTSNARGDVGLRGGRGRGRGRGGGRGAQGRGARGGSSSSSSRVAAHGEVLSHEFLVKLHTRPRRWFHLPDSFA